MSRRRTPGDRVWLPPGSGFGASKGQWGVITGDDDAPCLLRDITGCHDPNCREWNDVELDDGRMAYHVSECEMLDEPHPQKELQHEIRKYRAVI